MMQRLLLALSTVALILVPGVDDANAQFFGRNKVQYNSFDFKIIKTEHFDIYFYERERQAALDAARMVERAYARLTRVLQHEFEERKPIILYASHSDFQQTNATQGSVGDALAFVEPLKDRMVIPFTGSMGQFERVLTHELVHQFQFDILLGGGAMRQGGQSRRPPLWFTEGMAEYLALGEIDVITATWLRDAVLGGYLRNIAEMSQRDDYLSYRFGQALWTYIASTWGDEVVGVLLQRGARMGLERAFRTTLGISLEELNREWMTTVRKLYMPQVAEFAQPTRVAQPVVRHAQLTDDSYIGPAISSDGERMALFTTREGFFPDLWLADARTGEFERRLVESNREANFESLRYGSSSAAFSPDGRYLAFSAQTGGKDALYIYDLREDEIWKKLEPAVDGVMNPTWGPDGRRLAFAGLSGGLSDLFVVDVQTGELERLTDDRYADLFPSWSPDGSAIAFSTDRGDRTDFDKLTFSNLGVALYDLGSGEIEMLPHQDEGSNLNPVWSPDGRSLVWVGDRTGIKNLYRYDRDTGEVVRITRFLSGVMGPTATDLSPVLSWSRDSGRLLFVYFEAAGQSIYAIDDPQALEGTPVPETQDRNFAGPLIQDDEVDDAPAAEPADAEVVAQADPDTVGEETPEEDEAAPAPGDEDEAEDDERVSVASYYRTDDGFRPSSALPEGAAIEGEGPISIAMLLDSANLSLPDTAAFAIEDYGVQFSPDIIGRPTVGATAGGYYGNGVYGGSFIALSDMLGNHNVLMAGDINGSLSDAMFYGGYNYLKHRANFGFALQQVPMYRYIGTGQVPLDGGEQGFANVFTRDVLRQVQGLVSYPFSTYRRFELGANATFYKRDMLLRGRNISRGGTLLDETRRLQDATYLEPMAALVFDNTLFGWTGPIYGRRYRLQVSRSLGDFSYTEGLVDFRNYLNYDQSLVFASRFIGLVRAGQNPEQFSLYWGGPYFLRGYDSNSFDRDAPECTDFPGQEMSNCPLRHQLIGSSGAVMNLEVRFPLITELQIGFLGNFPPVDGVVFFDGGMAWDDQVCLQRDAEDPLQCAGEEHRQSVDLVWDREPGENPILVREPLFSTGVGLRLNIFYAVLRMDYAFPLSRPNRGGVFSISFGPSF